MTSIKENLIEIAILLCGMVAAIGAWVDTEKGWLSMAIMTMTMGIQSILQRLHDSRDK
jgi:hypothetical protein